MGNQTGNQITQDNMHYLALVWEKPEALIFTDLRKTRGVNFCAALCCAVLRCAGLLTVTKSQKSKLLYPSTNEQV